MMGTGNMIWLDWFRAERQIQPGGCKAELHSLKRDGYFVGRGEERKWEMAEKEKPCIWRETWLIDHLLKLCQMKTKTQPQRYRAEVQMKTSNKNAIYMCAKQNASRLTILPWSHLWGPGRGVYCGEWSGVCFHQLSRSQWPTGPAVCSSVGRCNWGKRETWKFDMLKLCRPLLH